MIDKILVREIVEPIVLIVIFSLVYFIVNRILKTIKKRDIPGVDNKKRMTAIVLINNLIKYTLMVICVIMILNVYGVDTSALLTSLGLLGLGVSFAIQDTLKDFLAGFFIIFENQYSIGDTVTINDFTGEVIFLGLRTTRIKSLTGEVAMMSNRNITQVINHSNKNSVAIVDVDVAYESDLDNVEEVLEKFCKKMSKELDNLKGELKNLGVISLGESSITYRLSVETLPMKHYEVERKIRKAVKQEFDKNKIEIPYRQVVVHSERL